MRIWSDVDARNAIVTYACIPLIFTFIRMHSFGIHSTITCVHVVLFFDMWLCVLQIIQHYSHTFCVFHIFITVL